MDCGDRKLEVTFFNGGVENSRKLPNSLLLSSLILYKIRNILGHVGKNAPSVFFTQLTFQSSQQDAGRAQSSACVFTRLVLPLVSPPSLTGCGKHNLTVPLPFTAFTSGPALLPLSRVPSPPGPLREVVTVTRKHTRKTPR